MYNARFARCAAALALTTLAAAVSAQQAAVPAQPGLSVTQQPADAQASALEASAKIEQMRRNAVENIMHSPQYAPLREAAKSGAHNAIAYMAKMPLFQAPSARAPQVAAPQAAVPAAAVAQAGAAFPPANAFQAPGR